jgi:hypothetical protein
VRESEGSQAVLQFGSIRVWEGVRRWHAVRRHDRMGGGGLGVLRKKKGPGWTMSWANTQKIPGKNENGLPTQLGPKSRMSCIKTFSNFKQGFGFKNQGFKYFQTGIN